MRTDLENHILRGRELLKSVTHAAMATVNADGSPHNTPYVFMVSPDLKHLYWGSHPKSQHSQNIERTGQLFVVLYDANERGGLYIEAENGHATSGAELEEALAVHNQVRLKLGKQPLPTSYYGDSSGQQMYRADAKRLWVNGAERGADGNVIRDVRYEIKASDLSNS